MIFLTRSDSKKLNIGVILIEKLRLLNKIKTALKLISIYNSIKKQLEIFIFNFSISMLNNQTSYR